MSIPPPSDVSAAPADAQTTASGLAYKVIQQGSGSEFPASNATVEVHYTGWMTNGQMFDSSVLRGQPASFPLDRVIKGWTEGLQLMKVGKGSLDLGSWDMETRHKVGVHMEPCV